MGRRVVGAGYAATRRRVGAGGDGVGVEGKAGRHALGCRDVGQGACAAAAAVATPTGEGVACVGGHAARAGAAMGRRVGGASHAAARRRVGAGGDGVKPGEGRRDRARLIHGDGAGACRAAARTAPLHGKGLAWGRAGRESDAARRRGFHIVRGADRAAGIGADVDGAAEGRGPGHRGHVAAAGHCHAQAEDGRDRSPQVVVRGRRPRTSAIAPGARCVAADGRLAGRRDVQCAIAPQPAHGLAATLAAPTAATGCQVGADGATSALHGQCGACCVVDAANCRAAVAAAALSRAAAAAEPNATQGDVAATASLTMESCVTTGTRRATASAIHVCRTSTGGAVAASTAAQIPAGAAIATAAAAKPPATAASPGPAAAAAPTVTATTTAAATAAACPAAVAAIAAHGGPRTASGAGACTTSSEKADTDTTISPGAIEGSTAAQRHPNAAAPATPPAIG